MPVKPSANQAKSSSPALIPMGHHESAAPIELKRPVTLIGSRSNARIHLISRSVSKAHALLVLSEKTAYIRDLASRTHVYVNGEQIREAELVDGDLIKIGSFTFRFSAGNRSFGRGREKQPPPATLEVVGGEMPVPLEERVMLIGRRSTSDIALTEDSVSTAHAVVFQLEGKRYVRDLGSRTGTFVNGVKIHQQELNPDDHLRIGETDLYYRPSDGVGVAEIVDDASASALAAAPAADEVDLGLDLPAEAPAAGGAAEEPLDEPAVDELLPEPQPESAEPEPAELQLAGEPQLSAPAPQAPPAVEEDDEAPLLEEAHLDELPDLPLEPADEQAGSVAAEPQPESPPFVPVAEQAQEPAPLDEWPSEPASIETADEVEPLSVEVNQPQESSSPLAISSEVETRAEDVSELAEAPAASDAVSRGFSEAEAPAGEPAESLSPPDETESAPLAPRRGWRSQARELPEQAEQPAAAETGTADAADDSVFRFSDPVTAETDSAADDSIGATGEVAVADELALAPQQEVVDVEEELTDLGLTSNLEDLVTPPARPQEHEELQPVDFSKLQQDHAADVADDVEEPAAAEESPPPLEAPLLDWSLEAPEPQAQEPRHDEPRPLIAPDAFAEIAQEPEEPPLLHEAPAFASEAPEAPVADEQAPAESAERAQQNELRSKPRRKGKRRGKAADVATEQTADERTEQLDEVEQSVEAPTPQLEEAPLEQFEQPSVEAATEAPAAPAWEDALEAAAEAPAEPSGEALKPMEPLLEERIEPQEQPIEVLDLTEPTVESALDLQPVAGASAEEPPAEHRDELSDTSFSRAVSEFTGDSTGPIVEPVAPADEAAEPEVAEAASEPQVEPVGEVVIPPAEPVADEQEQVDHGLEFEESPQLEYIKLSFDQSTATAEEADEPEPVQAFDLDEPLPGAEHEPPVQEVDAEADVAAADEVLAAAEPDVPAAEPEEARAEQQEPPRPQPEPQPVSPAPVPFSWGPNQDHFLGGAPVKLVEPAEANVAGAPATLEPPARQREEQRPAAEAPKTPPPPRPKRPGRETLIRNFGRGEAGDITIPPFAGSTPGTRGQITTAFDGLAMPPVREIDVFAQPSPPVPVSEDPLPEAAGLTPFDLSEAERPGRLPLQGKAPDEADQAPWQDLENASRPRRPRQPRPQRSPEAPRPPVVQMGDEELRQAELRRRSKLRRVPVLLAVMIILIVTATVLIWKFLPVSSIINASIAFKNFESLTEAQKRELRRDQEALLQDDQTRRLALQKLPAINPNLAPGFLGNPLHYPPVVQNVSWPSDARNGIMQISHNARDVDDADRLRAVLAAVHEQNRPLLEKIQQSRRAVGELQTRLAASGDEMRLLKQKIERERTAMEQRPTGEQIQALESQLAALEKTWNDRMAAVKASELELQRLRQQASSAAAPQAPVAPEDDPQLQQMQQRHAELAAQMTDVRSDEEQRLTEARRVLDEAVRQFEEQIADARRRMQDSPELLDYIATAENLLGDVRELNDKLIKTQQSHYAYLLSLKNRWTEVVEKLRNDAWQKDPELKELLEEKEIRTRQYNAAVASNLEREASHVRAQLDLIESSIAARQERLDPGARFSDMSNDLQKEIDRVQSEMAAERKQGDERFKEYQQRLAQSQPSIAKLPEEQKQLAQSLEAKLSAINDERTRYSRAVDKIKADAERDAAHRRTEMVSLQNEMEKRRAALAAADERNLSQQQAEQRNAEVAALQRELASLQQAESEAREAYFAKQRELRETQTRLADAEMAGDRLAELNHALQSLEVQRQQDQRQLESVTLASQKLVEPVEPVESSVQELGRDDKRPLVAGASAAGIFLLFSAWIVLTVVSAMREMPVKAAAPVAAVPPPADEDAAPRPAPPSSNDTTEEDHEPAVV